MKSEWNPIRLTQISESSIQQETGFHYPLTLHLQEASQCARSRQITNTPAHRHQGGEIRPEDIWCHFTCVRRGESLEDPPWYTQQNTSTHIHVNGVGEELHKDETAHQEEAAEHDISIAEAVGEPTIDEEA